MDGWNIVNSSKASKNNNPSTQPPINTDHIAAENPYRVLIVDEESNFEDEFKKNVPNKPEKRKTNTISKLNECDKLNTDKKPVPGNSLYSDITKKGKKVCIFSDSICNRINTVEFGRCSKYRAPIKRSYPGATASQLMYFVKPTLIEESPVVAIIHVGTNNLREKSKQSDMEVFNEIMNVVDECNRSGVNVYVSSITCRPSHQSKINLINKLLWLNQLKWDYKFIENSNITSQHIWKDRLHLNENDKGIS